ncbi:MAG: exosortase [Verrucomicrobia bacterium]|nr:exosortase [Verrucomicrobiota bacterium]MDE3100428.1 exosortase/archaeosortase family protein [Verrucomicrobiota bacterium]
MNQSLEDASTENLWRDTLHCWNRLPNKAFFFILLAAWLAIFQFWGNAILGYFHSSSLFAWLLDQYHQHPDDQGQGKWIPFLVAGLYWWRRHELLKLPLKVWAPGLFIVASALVLHLLGFFIQQTDLSIVALFAGVWGLMGLAWGRDWLRHSLFPFFLFVFCVPIGLQTVTFPLQELVSWLTEKVAHGLGVDVLREGTQLFDPSGAYQYEVAAACSGIHSLIAISLLAAVYGFLVFRGAWQRAFLLALSVPFAVLGNLLRMLLIIITAAIGGQAAGNFVHNNWLLSLTPYVPAIAGFLLIGRWMEGLEQKEAA